MVLKKWLACCAPHGVCLKVKETGVFFCSLLHTVKYHIAEIEKQTGGVLLIMSDC